MEFGKGHGKERKRQITKHTVLKKKGGVKKGELLLVGYTVHAEEKNAKKKCDSPQESEHGQGTVAKGNSGVQK